MSGHLQRAASAGGVDLDQVKRGVRIALNVQTVKHPEFSEDAKPDIALAGDHESGVTRFTLRSQRDGLVSGASRATVCMRVVMPCFIIICRGVVRMPLTSVGVGGWAFARRGFVEEHVRAGIGNGDESVDAFRLGSTAKPCPSTA